MYVAYINNQSLLRCYAVSANFILQVDCQADCQPSCPVKEMITDLNLRLPRTQVVRRMFQVSLFLVVYERLRLLLEGGKSEAVDLNTARWSRCYTYRREEAPVMLQSQISITEAFVVPCLPSSNGQEAN